MVLGEVVDAEEVKKLREENAVLKSSKLELEKASHSLTKKNNASADRIFALLTEKSELFTEYDSLGASVMELKIENFGLELLLVRLKMS